MTLAESVLSDELRPTGEIEGPKKVYWHNKAVELTLSNVQQFNAGIQFEWLV